MKPLIIGCLLTLVLTASKQAHAIPTPAEIAILRIISGGSGCPQGTTVVLTSTQPGGPADRLKVIFDQFEVQKGVGIPLSEQRKFCVVALELLIPQGFRFALTQVHYEGYARIPSLSTGHLRTEYFFPFFSNRQTVDRILAGPFMGSYAFDDTVALFSTVWSPCGLDVPLNMKSSLELRGPAGDPAVMTVDTATGRLFQLWAISWEKCEAPL